MKKLLLIALCFFPLSGLSGQQKKTPGSGIKMFRLITTTVPDNSSNSFFDRFPEIDEAWVGYNQDQPVASSIYFKNDREKMNSEYYDLTFEVDAYVFRYRYPGFLFPLLPSAVKVKDTCEMRAIRSLRMRRDSTEYWLDNKCASDTTPTVTETWIPLIRAAKYKGDINEIGRRIQMYNKRIRDTGDSILVFRGSIDKTGVLSNLELIAGQKSDYSYLIERDLNYWNKSSWIPGKLLVKNSMIQTFIKIFIRANKDGTITVLTSPRKPGNVTGR